MKKLLLASVLSALIPSAFAENTSANAVDYAQARPDSTVKENIVNEQQMTVETVQNGQVTSSATATTITPVEDVTKIEPPVKSLPAATITDESMDLEATMKQMGRNFKKIKSAEGDLSAMKAPAAELAKWASQAEALGLAEEDGKPATDEQKEKYAQGIQTIRKQVADLEVAIENNDADTVQVLINEMGDTRRTAHKYFDVK